MTFSTSEHREICRPFGVSMHAVVPSCTSWPPIQHSHGMIRPLPSCMRWNGDGCASCPRAGAAVIADRMTKPTTRAISGRIVISRLLTDLVPWYAVSVVLQSNPASRRKPSRASEDKPAFGKSAFVLRRLLERPAGVSSPPLAGLFCPARCRPGDTIATTRRRKVPRCGSPACAISQSLS